MVENPNKKRKSGKTLIGKNVTATLNTLDDAGKSQDGSDPIERPHKKGAHKNGKNKRKKQQQANEAYFCDAPSKTTQSADRLSLSFENNFHVICVIRSRIHSHGFDAIEWKCIAVTNGCYSCDMRTGN